MIDLQDKVENIEVTAKKNTLSMVEGEKRFLVADVVTEVTRIPPMVIPIHESVMEVVRVEAALISKNEAINYDDKSSDECNSFSDDDSSP